MSYAEFLARKDRAAKTVGVEVGPEDISPVLYDWQRESVLWALRKGRCSVEQQVELEV